MVENNPDAGKEPSDASPACKHIGTNNITTSNTTAGPIIKFSKVRVIRMPSDGSCLFHSFAYALGDKFDATQLRSQLASFILENPSLEIGGAKLEDWIKWDTGKTVGHYAKRINLGGLGGWGGGIECAAFARLFSTRVDVYEPFQSNRRTITRRLKRKREDDSCSHLKRMSCFDFSEDSKDRRTVNVVYVGCHYNALELL
mmetsp:Transcript_6241/g.9873  ORF Transcript_6241/g.9873 Transcript_6241/m.9873 type:complete len:200 (-) Transcript_6241:51-650(-)